MTEDIVKRLRKRQEFEFIDGHKRVEWEDEDALAAADRIEELREHLFLTATTLQDCLSLNSYLPKWTEFCKEVIADAKKTVKG